MSPIWRRRVILMAIVGLVIAIPVTLLVRGSGDDEPAPSAPVDLDEEFPLNAEVADKRLDAAYSVPKGWDLQRKKEALVLTSAENAVRIGISAPGPDEDAGQILDEALASLKKSYESVKVSPGGGSRVGGLKADGAVVTARGDNVDLRILVAAMEGKKKAYLVEVFTAADASPDAVAEAQRFLDSLQLRG